MEKDIINFYNQYTNRKNMLRIIWTSNILFPDITEHLKLNNSIGGGWMYSLAKLLKDDISLAVVSIHNKEYHTKIDGIDYYLIDEVNERKWSKIITTFKPDIIHIQGTEYPFTLKIKQYSDSIPCIASIQGLISVYSRYTLGGLSSCDIIKNLTIKDLIKQSSPYSIQKSQTKRGISEKLLIKSLPYIIGRTEWDKSHSLALNSNISYFKCNEVLRDLFYISKWDFNSANRYSIFCSNSSVPLKGIHQVVKAMGILKESFPNITLRIAGKNILGNLSFKSYLKLSGYDRYLRNLIYRLGLEQNISFLGHLSAEQMKEEFLKTNVFILPSCIENSPNSLGEAQLLGVPILAANVGGNEDMMPFPLSEYLYRFEEIEILAHKLKHIFQTTEWNNYSSISQKIAHHRHSPSIIKENLLNIYKLIYTVQE